MSDDWQIGDRALCVKGGRGRKLITRVGDVFYLENGDRTLKVAAGGIYTVTNLAPLIGPNKQLALGFRESAGPWCASRFRKIRPHQADEEDRETIRLLNGAPAMEPTT